MDVSIIMINYNTLELTRNALNSIFAFTEGIRYEIILIDNASPDGSGEILQSEFSERIIYIQAGKNLGTSKSFNLGLKSAVGKYVLWLNTDILIRDNFIGTLFQFMESNLDCGICGGNVLNFEGMPMHSFRRNLPSLKTDQYDLSFIVRLWRKLWKKSLSTEYNFTQEPLEVGYITGADMMVRKEIFDKIGGFDEKIFMYAEECEFTFRMKKLTNYKVISVPNAKIYHLEGASFGGKKKFNENRFRISTIGLAYYFTKCYDLKTAKKFLKQHIRAYWKCVFLYLIINWKRLNEYRTRIWIVSKLYKNFSTFTEMKYENL